jgi:hypothetical protein
MFELSPEEVEIVVSQFVIPNRRKLGGREIGFHVREKTPPYRVRKR